MWNEAKKTGRPNNSEDGTNALTNHFTETQFGESPYDMCVIPGKVAYIRVEAF